MQFHNFAPRVTTKRTLRTDSMVANADEKARVSTWVNSAKLVINRKEFAKTPQERLELKIAKAKWKASPSFRKF